MRRQSLAKARWARASAALLLSALVCPSAGAATILKYSKRQAGHEPAAIEIAIQPPYLRKEIREGADLIEISVLDASAKLIRSVNFRARRYFERSIDPARQPGPPEPPLAEKDKTHYRKSGPPRRMGKWLCQPGEFSVGTLVFQESCIASLGLSLEEAALLRMSGFGHPEPSASDSPPVVVWKRTLKGGITASEFQLESMVPRARVPASRFKVEVPKEFTGKPR